MPRLITLLTAVVGTVACFFAALVLAFTHATPPPSPEALGEIPPSLLGVYRAAAQTCPGLEWEVLAAVGWVESRHGQGRVDPFTGQVKPPIMGPPLDGRAGFARIPDATQPDGWAHALGPMQFLSTTWQAWGRSAPGRPGPPDVHNAWDAAYGAAAYLCGAAGRIVDVRAALLRYNHSQAYVDQVLAKAAAYRAVTIAVSGPSGLSWPVDGPVVSGFGSRFHPILHVVRFHAGIDISAPGGTPIHAPAAGTVLRAGGEGGCGNAITLAHGAGLHTRYCHLSRIGVHPGDIVASRQVIGWVGATGLATGPHLHFEITRNGSPIDPLTELPPR